MIWFVMAVVLGFVAGAVIAHFAAHECSWEPDAGEWARGILLGICTWIGASIFLSIVAVPICMLTGGLWPDYSVGERTGYVTKTSLVGAIWKTYEVELQVGTGQMAALQEPHKFSVPDVAMRSRVHEFAGTPTRVRVRYKQWALQPYRRGSSGYEITGIQNAPE